MAAKVPGMVGTVDVLLGNLEDAVKADNKEAARAGLVADRPGHRLRRAHAAVDAGQRARLARGCSTTSPRWSPRSATSSTSSWCPRSQGAEDIHYVDRLLAQLEARAGLTRPILVHAILETARGVANVEEIAGASPRMQGISPRPGRPRRRPPDEDDPRRRRPPRLPRAPGPASAATRRRAAATYQQDLWHYTIARMVDACAMHGIFPYYGPFGDIKDVVACEDQFRNAFLLGCVGAWIAAPGADRHRQAGLQPRRRRTSPTPAGSWRRWATAPAR